jgi:hypothetical protein
MQAHSIIAPAAAIATHHQIPEQTHPPQLEPVVQAEDNKPHGSLSPFLSDGKRSESNNCLILYRGIQ